MVLRQVTLAINDYCNNLCVMCNIHENEWKDKMSVSDYRALFCREEFKQLSQIDITGGEPFLRRDLHDIVDVILSEVPHLQWLWINTNGTFPSRVREFIDRYATRIPKVSVSISIEGEKDIHEVVRGVKSFELAMETLKVAAKSHYPNVSASVSMTITPFNADLRHLQFVRELARRMNCSYTFRMAGESEIYYRNKGKHLLRVTPKAQAGILEFITKNCFDDPFQRIQKQYLETGKTGLTCTAGTDFLFIQADGQIYPCIFSTRKIGNKVQGLLQTNIADLGKYEPCPCCTECTVYPMLNYGPKANQLIQQNASSDV